MAIVKMKHLRLAAMSSDRDELLRLLQRMGCVEIDEPSVDRDDPAWAGLDRPASGGLTAVQEQHSAVERALGLLKRYAPEKGGLLRPRPDLTEGQLFDEKASQAALEAVEEINSTERRINTIRAERLKLEGQKAVLAPWLGLDLPLETQSTPQVTIQFGTLPVASSFEQAEGAALAAGDLAQLTLVSADREQQYCLLICHSSQSGAVLEALKDLGWSRAGLRDWTGTAADNTARLDQQLEGLARELAELEDKLAGMGQLRPALERLSDRTAVEISREESRGRMLDTSQVFFLEGWVPAESWPGLEQELTSRLCAFAVSDPAPEEYPKVPVKLKNNFFSRCMNVVTEMYSLPAYDGLDPNPLMAPFFILFFGVMLADMAYGILMVAAALFVLKRAKPREGTRNFMELVLWCGISTFIVGAMTGGFFGDFIPQLLRIINPDSTFTMPALFTPLDDTVAILLGSLVLGVIQVLTGMIISVVKKIKDGEFVDALFDEITWWIILGGGALAIFGIGFVAGVPVVLVVGCLMLAFGGTRKAKGFGKLASLVGLVYNGVTGYFSDILSYMRLMALMLAGSVIAQVFNTLGSVFGNVLIFFVISMIGNALNLALNLLGCYVHDLRLQCLEFFNRFYKEGGRPYVPLSFQTKYVDIIKEEQ